MKKKELIYYIIMSNLMWTMCLGMALLQKFVFHIAYFRRIIICTFVWTKYSAIGAGN